MINNSRIISGTMDKTDAAEYRGEQNIFVS